VRCGDDPRFGRFRVLGAQREDPAVLQDPQHLRLEIRARVPDLIQEDRAPPGEREPAPSIGYCTRESSPYVPEQLRLQQRIRQRGAVHGDERVFRER
jgi:hypothetical protein